MQSNATADRPAQRRLAIFDATPSAYAGGYEQFATKLEAAARDSGWEAEIVTPSSANFLRVATMLGAFGRFKHLSATSSPARNWNFLKRATHAYVKNEHLDMMWWQLAGGQGARTTGFHTPLRYPADSPGRIVRNALYANSLYGKMLRGSCLHFLNRYDYDALPRNARDLPSAIIPNGIETQAADAYVHNGFRVLFAGRLTPQKGLDRLTGEENARIIGPLTVLGDGPQSARLRNELKVATFLGTVSRETAIAQMREHSVLVMPSRWEGLPLTLLEAMSVGCVPVVSTIPTLRDVLPAELSWLAVDFESPQQVESVFGRLRMLHASAESWQRLREQLIEHVRTNYDERVQLQKLLRFIETRNGTE